MDTPDHLILEEELFDDVREIERIIGESVNPPFPEPEVLSDKDVDVDDSKDQEAGSGMNTLTVDTICGIDKIRTNLTQAVVDEKNDWLIDAYKHLKDQIEKADTFFQRESGKEYEWFYVKGKSNYAKWIKAAETKVLEFAGSRAFNRYYDALFKKSSYKMFGEERMKYDEIDVDRDLVPVKARVKFAKLVDAIACEC